MSFSVAKTPGPLLSTTSDDEKTPSLKLASSTPGTLATTASYGSPFFLFSQPPSSANKTYDFESDTDESLKSRRLGIQRPAYGADDELSKASTSSRRIGIQRPNYELPAGDLPISPLDLYLKKKSGCSAPNLVEIDDDNSDGPAWNLELVTPAKKLQAALDDGSCEEADENQLVHLDTSKGHYLLNAAPLDAPIEGMRYSLTKGKRGMTHEMLRASDTKLTTPKTRPSFTKAFSAPIQASPESSSFKIFLLLLQPKSKIFELIQVIYSPISTTIGDLLAMIPSNATEEALGKQSYIGLCRPKDGSEITDMSLMASGHNSDADCARITLGEILVAIPTGYTGELCSAMSKPLLANPKIAKLLKRSEPLAPRRKSERKKRRSRRQQEPIIVVETVKEEEEPPVEADDEASKNEMEQAIQKATVEAAASNAALHQGEAKVEQDDDKELFSPRAAPVTPSTTNLEDGRFLFPAPSFESIDSSGSVHSYDSLNGSFTFQSKSKRIPRRRSSRRRQRRDKRKAYMLRMAAASLSFMIGHYLMDTDFEFEEEPMESVLGFLGMFQTLILLLGLIKMQKYVKTKGANSDRKCPVMKASSKVLTAVNNKKTTQVPDIIGGG